MILSSDWPFCATQPSMVQGALAKLHMTGVSAMYRADLCREMYCSPHNSVVVSIYSCWSLPLSTDTVLSRCAASDFDAAWIQLVQWLCERYSSVCCFLFCPYCRAQLGSSCFGRMHTLKAVKYSVNRQVGSLGSKRLCSGSTKALWCLKCSLNDTEDSALAA